MNTINRKLKRNDELVKGENVSVSKLRLSTRGRVVTNNGTFVVFDLYPANLLFLLRILIYFLLEIYKLS